MICSRMYSWSSNREILWKSLPICQSDVCINFIVSILNYHTFRKNPQKNYIPFEFGFTVFIYLSQIQIMQHLRRFIIFSIFLLISCGPKLSTELKVTSITSDSRLRGIEAPWEHDPILMLDGNSKTNWCADGDTATITLTLQEPIEVEIFQILNGIASSGKASLANAQVSKLKLTPFLAGKQNHEPITLDFKKLSFEGNGTPRPETLRLERPLKGDKFEFQILESIKGSSSLNVCITDFQLGYIKNDKEEFYPLADKSILTTKVKEYEKAKVHHSGWSMLIKYTHSDSNFIMFSLDVIYDY